MQFARGVEIPFPFLLPCAQCGEAIVAPLWSEHVNDRCVRHLWRCDVCNYQFESEVYLRAAVVDEVTRDAA
jgi:hypothetical protein